MKELNHVRRKPKVDGKYVLDWVERVANFFLEQNGLPPITGRILGWLLVCDPAEQSAGEIAEAIGASRASLTTSMRVLTAVGIVRRTTRPGGRTAYYRIEDNAWERVIRLRIMALTSFRDITSDAIGMLGADSPRATRLKAAHTMFGWLADLLATSPGPGARKQAAKAPGRSTARRR